MMGESAFDPRRALLDWWNAGNRRDLPWRRDRDPYRILVSEIMLQQTQVDRVVPFFEAFVARFPSFEALAQAARGEVIRLWAGLGYNRRAVQLHQLARVVVERHGGRLPADGATLRRLPGIGPYTCGAVLSIAFEQPEPAMDTNVRRVVARYGFRFMPSPKQLEEAARRLLPREEAGEWNQALMDLGSAVCLGGRPRCLICPLRPGCESAGLGGGRRARSQPQAGASFVGSSRYYRGQLLAQLRAYPTGVRVPLPQVAERLMARGVAEPPAGWAAIGDSLARDGLVRVECSDKGVALGID